MIHNFRISTNQRLKSAGKGGNGGSKIGSCIARLELVTGKPRLLEFQFTVLCRYWLFFVFCFVFLTNSRFVVTHGASPWGPFAHSASLCHFGNSGNISNFLIRCLCHGDLWSVYNILSPTVLLGSVWGAMSYAHRRQCWCSEYPTHGPFPSVCLLLSPLTSLFPEMQQN